ncbi:MAG: hypothetical protein QF685_05765 [Verrucomicrobiota bacterium]|jgi:uncharacterized membrane protein|nr:hypothetical protein [Verrucomicrobiota bacterium]
MVSLVSVDFLLWRADIAAVDVARESLMLAADTMETGRPELHFAGELSVAWALGLGVMLAALSWWLYRRDLNGRAGWTLWVLPLLRGLLILALLGILTGPVLITKTPVGTTSRVLVFADGSASMMATDEQMETDRKLRILAKLGWTEGVPKEDHLRRAKDQLGLALRRVGEIRFGRKPAELQTGVKEVQATLETAARHLTRAGPARWSSDGDRRFRAEVLEPVAAIEVVDGIKARDALLVHQPALTRWHGELGRLLREERHDEAKDLGNDALAAIRRFDQTPRWQRLQQALLGGDESVFEQLTADHKTDLIVLSSNNYRLVWHPNLLNAEGKVEMPKKLGVEQSITNNLLTDLVSGVDQAVANDSDMTLPTVDGVTHKQRLFVVLLTDGQHNVDTRPQDLARRLGNRRAEMHVVGVGTTRMPRDLVVLKVVAPGKVFPNTILSGEVVINDGMPPGEAFRMTIEHQGKPVMDDQGKPVIIDLLTTEAGRRPIPFRFPIEAIVEKQRHEQTTNLQHHNLPLAFDVRLTPVEGEVNPDNNHAQLRVNVVTQKSKMLIVDGRPRWEQRYLNTLFDRDERWMVRSVVANMGGKQGLGPRGPQMSQFPETRAQLFEHQLIILGDVASQMFRQEELQWLRDFVQYNGGGIIFIDGHQERLVNFAGTVLEPLFPVRWTGAADYRSLNLEYRPLSDQDALQLSTDAAANADIWRGLPGPRRISIVQKKEGAEIHLEVLEGAKRAPAMVFKPYGAGRVLYCASDESWRWRYEVGDRYHERFWKQAAKWIMEEPFAVTDRFVKFDTGRSSYEVNEQAPIRLRVHEPSAMIRMQKAGVKPSVLLYRNGDPDSVARIPLNPDFNSAMYRGRTPPLEGGYYLARPVVPGIPEEQIQAHTRFSVSSVPAGEMGLLHCNEKLLRQMAADSGGKYYAEEDLGLLVENLRTDNASGEILGEHKLWQSFWVFLPIIVLLSTEWVLRKVAGLV